MIDLTALEEAAALMLADHPEGCSDREFWEATAALLEREAANAGAAAQRGSWLAGHPETGWWYEHALRVACAYLDVHAPAAGTEVTS